MSWAGEALAALRKIIMLEELRELTRMVRDLDHRLIERLSEKPRPRRLSPQD